MTGEPTPFRWVSVAECRDCWDEQNPGREPSVDMTLPLAVCVTCGEFTTDGIWVRAQLTAEVHQYMLDKASAEEDRREQEWGQP